MIDLATLKQQAVDRVKRVAPPSTRRRVLEARSSIRSRTARWRVLPDVLVVGTMRGGTSSLYKYLGYHPSVAPSLRKEVEYFSRYHAQGVDWYRSHFPTAARLALHERARRERMLSFEASPYYLAFPTAPVRAAGLLPEAKIIALLRDPVERAHSHWQLLARKGIEELSFAEAVDAEAARLGPEIQRMEEEPGYFSKTHFFRSYITRGMYAEQLARWLAHYRPEQVLVLWSEDLFREPEHTYAEVLRFLGLRTWRPQAFRNYSRVDGGRADLAPAPIDPKLRAELESRFAGDQAALGPILARVSVDHRC